MSTTPDYPESFYCPVAAYHGERKLRPIHKSEDLLELWEEEPCAASEAINPCGEAGLLELTDADYEALLWIGSRYLIADILLRRTSEIDNPDGSIRYVCELDPAEIGWCLAYEGCDRIPCMSEDSILNKLVRAIGPDDESAELSPSDFYGEGHPDARACG